ALSGEARPRLPDLILTAPFSGVAWLVILRAHTRSLNRPHSSARALSVLAGLVTAAASICAHIVAIRWETPNGPGWVGLASATFVGGVVLTHCRPVDKPSSVEQAFYVAAAAAGAATAGYLVALPVYIVFAHGLVDDDYAVLCIPSCFICTFTTQIM